VEESRTRKLNRLPLREYEGPKAYLVTAVIAARIAFFAEDEIAVRCVAELKEAVDRSRFGVYAYCFMPDHLHMLVAGRADAAELIDFVKRFKQKTGWWFKNSYAGGLKASPTGLWQRSYHDHILRSEEGVRQAAEYVVANPVQAGITQEIGEYPYAGSFVWPDLNPIVNQEAGADRDIVMHAPAQR
jgi:putative transposase